VNLSPNREGYAGDEACRTCHSEKLENYFHTAHHLTSRLPTKDSIAGSFASGKNILKTSNAGLYFHMESKPDGFYQTSMSAFPPVAPIRSERMDIVIGSGRVGQTYLFWKDDRLFQLPVSYWIDLGSWVNSPGYRDGIARYDRPVIPRCLECHMTYAQELVGQSPPNRYKQASLVMGISCERCHGPASAHVAAVTKEKSLGVIVNPAKLTRERQIEVCAQCHSGKRNPLLPSFSYVPGEPLDDFLDPPDPNAKMDVHGNQVSLLQMSRCFQNSAELTCSTCHNVHQVQREAAGFSDHCRKCHRPETCGEFSKLQEKIVGGCVDCHMPVQPSSLIILNSNGKQTRAMKRSHWIKIYPGPQTP